MKALIDWLKEDGFVDPTLVIFLVLFAVMVCCGIVSYAAFEIVKVLNP